MSQVAQGQVSLVAQGLVSQVARGTVSPEIKAQSVWWLKA